MCKVVKFGGSSLASAKQFEKVSAIVKSNEERRYVIVSAPGKRFDEDTKVTDMLYACYDLAKKDKPFADKLMEIRERYEEIKSGCGLKVSLEEVFEEIEQGFLEKRGADFAASRGEYLNGLLMAEYLDYEFVDAKDGIFFREDGYLDEKKTYESLYELLSKHRHAVIPGFYGQAFDGSIKTFSRGGSDITGSIVARAMHATSYENWTDVSGVLMADPRIVKNPVGIDSINYKELRELSYMGASVLHEDAVFPVRSEGIPIHICNTNAPDDEGTWIVEDCWKEPAYGITGIAGRKEFVSLQIYKDLMCSEVDFNKQVMSAMKKSGVTAEHVLSGIDALTILVPKKDYLHKKERILEEMDKISTPELMEIEEDFALVAVVGRTMKQEKGCVGRIFASLAHADIPIKCISQSCTGQNVILGVSNAHFEKAIQAIYDIFVLTQL